MANQKQIRIIADDGGNSPEQDAILRRLAVSAAISGVSAFVPRFSSTNDALAMSQMESIEWGLHLNLTDGTPYAPKARVDTLVDEEGNFLRPAIFNKRALSGKLNKQQLQYEIGYQIDQFLALFKRLDHIDSHRHVHRFPCVADLLAKELKKRALKPRLRNPCRCLLPSTPCRSRFLLQCQYYLADYKRIPGILLKKRVVQLLKSTGGSVGEGLLTPWPTIAEADADAQAKWIHAIRACPVGDWEINLHPGWSEFDRTLLENQNFQSAWKCFS
jgi:hypothetical protein